MFSELVVAIVQGLGLWCYLMEANQVADFQLLDIGFVINWCINVVVEYQAYISKKDARNMESFETIILCKVMLVLRGRFLFVLFLHPALRTFSMFDHYFEQLSTAASSNNYLFRVLMPFLAVYASTITCHGQIRRVGFCSKYCLGI
ncbi:hypothetical protein V6N12_049618 [Hibiscus sabdariffa]|uniref:Uncharacterized protein n=1 Tax=Hibiscus sabdariffa TaxID=183260 RepID=A0ABR2GAL9_9ROSI